MAFSGTTHRQHRSGSCLERPKVREEQNRLRNEDEVILDSLGQQMKKTRPVKQRATMLITLIKGQCGSGWLVQPS